MWLMLLVGITSIATACGNGPPPPTGLSTSTSEALQPASTPLPPPAAILPNGQAIKLELAISPQQRSTGLMFRTSLAADRGMLFVFERAVSQPFWMKNTFIPLDFVFLDHAGQITEIIPDVPPCEADPCPNYPPQHQYRAMLELSAGVAAANGLEPGQRLTFERVPDFPFD